MEFTLPSLLMSLLEFAVPQSVFIADQSKEVMVLSLSRSPAERVSPVMVMLFDRAVFSFFLR